MLAEHVVAGIEVAVVVELWTILVGGPVGLKVH